MAPLATAITGVAAYRMLCFWLPLPSALAHLPALRETIRQASDNPAGRTRQAPPISGAAATSRSAMPPQTPAT